MLRKLPCVAGAAALAFGVFAYGTATVAGATGRVCSGTPTAPGLLAGTYSGDVTVDGVCFVNGGPAVVRGNLTISEGSGLVAAFANNDLTGSGPSNLTVSGNVTVQHRGVLLLGCIASSFPCFDDPHPRRPTLESHDIVAGSLIGLQALGVLAHNDTIHGDIDQGGGGGGVNCNPDGVFKAFGSPDYSTYEDSRVDGDVRIHGNRSCWMGVIRLRVYGSVSITNNVLADPDAIEINSNRISGDLTCRANSMVWDSSDASETGLFPRDPAPNTVHGRRSGDCVLSSPTSPTDPLGPDPF